MVVPEGRKPAGIGAGELDGENDGDLSGGFARDASGDAVVAGGPPPRRRDAVTENDQEAAALSAAVGRAVRETRKGQQLTLQVLATKAGLSAAFLSQLENGVSMPSLLTLHRVAAVLGTSAHSLLERGATPQIEVVRHGEGRTHPLTRGATLRFLTEGRRQMGPTEVHAEAFTAAAEPTEHAGEEFTYVTEGQIVMEIGAETLELGPGDALYYPATIRHRWRNDADQPARFLIVTNPPTF